MGNKSRPYNLLLLLAIVLLLVSILTNADKVIDIHIHDTMFVIAYRHFLWLLASVSISLWLLGLLTGKFLKSNILSWAHVVATVLPLIVLSLGLLMHESDSNEIGEINSDNWKNYYVDTYATAFTIASIILLLGQSLFLLNVVLGLVKRKN